MTMKTKKTLQHIAAVAVVLLTLCLVFAAPVSAEGTSVTVTTYDELMTNLSNPSVATIIIGNDITATRQVVINRTVTIDGQWHTISAAETWSDYSGSNKHLINVINRTPATPDGADYVSSGVLRNALIAEVTLENVTFDSKSKAYGVQFYNSSALGNFKLENCVITNSNGTGLTLNGATVSVTNLTVKESKWHVSVDIQSKTGVASKFTMEDTNTWYQLMDSVAVKDDGKTGSVYIVTEELKPLIKTYDIYGSHSSNLWTGNEEMIGSLVSSYNATVIGEADTVQFHQNLTAAFENAVNGDTVTLLKDVELTESIDITEGMDVTIEGSGKTMSISGDNVFYIDGGKLTLGEGLNVYSSTSSAIYILNGEVITSANVKTDAEYGAIQGDGDDEGIVTVNGGTIESEKDCGIYHPQNAPLTINGGTIKGKTAVYFKSGSLSITDGTFIGNGDKVAYVYWGNGCIPTGDALVIENVGGTTGYEAITSVSITGGTFTSANAAAVASYAATEVNSEAVPVTAFITGGTFSSNPSAYIAGGMEVVQPVDKYLVQKSVDRSSSSSSSVKPEEPEQPEQPEEPVVEPETPAAPGEVASSTEVTDGGEVAFETTVVDDETGEQSAPAAADEEIKGVVLPTGTEGTVEFVPISEQPAPAGQEENTKRVFEINVPSYKKGEAAVIKFQMTVAELAADGKEAADVALWHFDEETGEWTKLVTSYTIVDGVVYFEAITEDFSPFAIIYEDEPVDEPVEEPETPASPAPVLGLLAALGAAVVLRRK